MDFRSYRNSQGWTLDQAAELLSTKDVRITGSMVRKHEEGIHVPRPDAIERYRVLTGGKVTADDFVKANRQYMQRKRSRAAA